jgi:hypothetical protein
VKAEYDSPIVAVCRKLASNTDLAYCGASSRPRIASNLSSPYDEISFVFCRTLTTVANATGLGGWETALSHAQSFIDQLTTEEKFAIVTGTAGYFWSKLMGLCIYSQMFDRPCTGNIAPIPRLHFSGLCLQDGPLSIRQAVSMRWTGIDGKPLTNE